jgi:hypothetical protein
LFRVQYLVSAKAMSTYVVWRPCSSRICSPRPAPSARKDLSQQ